MSDDVKRVSAPEAKQLLDEGYDYLDVRTEAEFAAGHPVGARNVPFLLAGPAGMVKNDDFVRVVAASFAKDRKLVVGCKAGGRSLKAVKLLQAEGYTALVDMRPGWGGARNAFGAVTEPGWQASELPSELQTDGGSYQEMKAKA